MENIKKVALITGAGSGIGRATAVEFAKYGYRLSILGRRKHKLEETAELCIKEGLTRDDIKILPCDVLIDDQIKASMNEMIESFQRLDVLVNNAGYGSYAQFYETKIEDFDEMYKIHTRAPILLMLLAYPYLKETVGNIVNVSSGASDVLKISMLSAYSVGKAGLNTASVLAARDFGMQGKVRVNVVLPGMVKTDIFEAGEKSFEHIEEASKTLPIGKYSEPEDIAKSIVFLARDETGKHITGTKFDVMGGARLVFP